MVAARQRKSGNGWGPPVLGYSKTTSREDEDGATCSWVAIVTWKREKTMGCSAAPFKLKQGGEMGGWGDPVVATWWEKEGGMAMRQRRWRTGSQ
jgi:hypothetical protein